MCDTTDVKSVVEELKFLSDVMCHIDQDLRDISERLKAFHEDVFIGLSRGGR